MGEECWRNVGSAEGAEHPLAKETKEHTAESGHFRLKIDLKINLLNNLCSDT